jgi:predicted tellurium resistance membrane protein TerC
MSLDNMLAVGAASHGSFFLLMFGLGLSIPIILFCSALVAMMMNKWPWLVYVGGGILGWVSGEMIVADKLIAPHLEFGGKFIHYGIPVLLTIAIVVVGKLCEKKAGEAQTEKHGETAVAK